MSKTYKVSGMTCGGCARSLESAIKAAAPAASVAIDLASGRVTVDNVADDTVIERAVDEAGFTYGGAA
jgi:copper chaperone